MTYNYEIFFKKFPDAGCFYSTFNTSLIAFTNESFGKAPIAICGWSSLGTNNREGML